jgi:serine/threonine protein kinase
VEDDVTQEGAAFNGYLLLRLLGRGGAGEVYLAASPTGEEVAIKIFREARGEATAINLMQQAQAVSTLQHPNILPCYGDATEGNDLAIVMALAEGGSLGNVIGARRPTITLPLRPAVVSRLVTQAARALNEAHAHGLVHGDLKPNNLFVRTNVATPTVAIGDFGQGFLPRAAVAALRQSRSGKLPAWVADQLAWVAPEQLRGQAVAASDQYALAALAYFLLTGIQPISAEAQTLLSGRATRSIASPSRLNSALGDEVDVALFHALSPLPHQRFDDVLGFARAFEDAVGFGPSLSGLPGEVRRFDAGASALRPAKRTLAQMSAVQSPMHRAPGKSSLVLDAASLPVFETPYTTDAPTPPPEDPKRRGPLAIALALLLLAILGAFVFTASHGLPFAPLAASGTPTAVVTATPANTDEAVALARLRTALAGQPIYSDALTGDPANWTVNDKSTFFGADHRLHLRNTAKTALFENMPPSVALPKGAYIASVDVTLVQGANVHAGMWFLVSSSISGATYYSYQVTPDGRFELWVQRPDTGLTFLTSGFVPALTAGLGKNNTLAVLIDPVAQTLTLFANNTFVFETPIRSGVALSGRLGVATPDSNVEASFANFAVYTA